ncbi:MAG: HPr family phosphocarrier protein [Candidatus Izemoplasmatales bacterium]|jgi:phosphotransferase system HPr-like phosphotransfer protein
MQQRVSFSVATPWDRSKAAKIEQVATMFDVDIKLIDQNITMDIQAILGIMRLNASERRDVVMMVSGVLTEEAMTQIRKILE